MNDLDIRFKFVKIRDLVNKFITFLRNTFKKDYFEVLELNGEI